MFVGEIGFPRKEFLYEIAFWEARAILKGYRNRYRDLWSVIRWHAYNVMSAMPYCDLQKAGVYSPTDLMKLPWDNEGERDDIPSDEEIERIRQELIQANNTHSSNDV